MKSLLLTGTLAMFLVGPVAALESNEKGEPQKVSCAWARNIDTFKIIDDKTVILEQSPRRRYKATLTNRCRALKHSFRIAVDSHNSCLRAGDALIIRKFGDTRRCYIDNIVLLPQEENSDETGPKPE